MPVSGNVIDVHCGWGATPYAPTWNDIGAVQTAMNGRGIQTVFMASLLARRYDLTTGNDALAAVLPPAPEDNAPAAPDRPDVRGWLVVHPARLADSLAQMRKHLQDEKFVGVALYSDPVTSAPVTSRDVRELVAGFRRYSRPMLVETPNARAMAEAVRMTEELPGVKIIASGMGGEEWREAVDMAGKPMNLFLDISGSLDGEKLEYAFQSLNGSRKLVFASGGPYTDPAAVRGLLDDADLPMEDKERILYSNAARLFRIGLNGGSEGVALTSLSGFTDAPPAIPNYMVGNENNG